MRTVRGSGLRRSRLVAVLPIAAAATVLSPLLTNAQAHAAAAPCATMQVVAHEDDDLLFLNPDIQSEIRNGQCTVTVFATAGNGEPTVRARQAGIKDAYRIMANVADLPDQTEWDADPATVAGYHVEQFVLRDRPDVRLAFVNIDDPWRSTGRPGLSELWNNQASAVAVIDPDTDSQTTAEPTAISRTGVLDLLAGLLGAYRPTTVRIQDVLPDSRYMTDHIDHVAAAQFAQAAVHIYRLATGIAPNVVYYRDYNISSNPENLDVTGRTDKDQAFSAGYVPLNPTGGVDANGYYWTNRTYYRWARGTSWVGRDADGRLEAFAVRDAEVFNWSQAADGSWSGPRSLGRPGQGVYPAVVVTRNADGRLQIFTRGLDDTLSTTYQTTASGTSWSAWASLGNPDAGTSGAGQLGTPAAAVNADGRLSVFVKDASGAVSTRKQSTANGTTWSTWSSLGGSGVQDPVVAITHRGLIEMFASTTSSVLHWRQQTANGSITRDTAFPGGRPASPPAVGVNQDGRLELHYRAAGSTSAAAGNDLELVVQNTVGGSWRSAHPRIGTQGGFGEPALLSTGTSSSDVRVLAFTRNRNAGVALVRQSGPNDVYSASEDLGGQLVDYPAAAVDRNGLVNVFAIGLDGALWINRQSTAGPAAPFTTWTRAGD